MNNFSKIQIKLVRSFSLGFTIASPTLNGFSLELHISCIDIHIWSKAKGCKLVSFKNYWVSQS